MSNKIYVIDTNVLMYAGKKAITSFKENEVVIPFVVVEELEKKRLEDGLIGAMARSALREVDSLRATGKLKSGIKVNKEGGTFRVEMNHQDESNLPKGYKRGNSNDARILIVAHNLYLEEKGKAEGRQVILVTNDIPLRIKADSVFDFTVENFRTTGNQFSGVETVTMNDSFISDVYAAGSTKSRIPASPVLLDKIGDIANHAFVLKSGNNGSSSAVGVVSDKKFSLINHDLSAMSVKGKSIPQKIALNYLYDQDKKIVSIGGKAGTGKTLLSVVAGIDQITNAPKNEDPAYRKIIVIRPIYSVGGQEMGFLPGDAEDKMAPWRKAIYDSVEGIVSSDVIEKMNEEGLLDVMPATYLRGRSLHNAYVIVDESQNFEPSVLLTILSRIGQGSKIVFLWDANQKDNARIGYNDGIVSVVDKLKSNSMFAHISLERSERSDVAELAGNILEDYIF